MGSLQNAVGARLRELREAKGWTLDKLAQRLGRSKQGISAIETGKVGPSLDVLVEIAAAVGGQVDIRIRPAAEGSPMADLQEALDPMNVDDLRWIERIARMLPHARQRDRDLVIALLQREDEGAAVTPLTSRQRE